MKIKFIKTKYHEYAVHIEKGIGFIILFQAFPIEKFDDNMYGYWDKRTLLTDIHFKFNNDCLMCMEGSLCWRGVWEERIYFPDGSEHSGLDLFCYNELWELLYPILKDMIKSDNPDYKYFDE
jgi:hypothetical protein